MMIRMMIARYDIEILIRTLTEHQLDSPTESEIAKLTLYQTERKQQLCIKVIMSSLCEKRPVVSEYMGYSENDNQYKSEKMTEKQKAILKSRPDKRL